MDSIENEFAMDVIKAFCENQKRKQNSKYDLNPDKCDKMNDIIAYCQRFESEYDCKIIRCMLEPKYEQGYIQVLFQGELVVGEKQGNLNDFIETLKLCDGINITTNPAGEDMFQITFFVENLWVPKSR